MSRGLDNRTGSLLAGLRMSLAAGAVFFAAGLAPKAEAAEIYGLVVGINDYVGKQNDLDGAVNDAQDIASALDKAGAKTVIRLFDKDANKKNIEDAWNKLVDTAKEGDTIVFTYAGHGSQEPEPAGRNDEVDGKNENFLLAGYQPKGEGTKERIVDDEISQWLKQADDRNIRVVFVADSCHSGSMHRSARAETVKFRNGEFGAITDDQLNFPPPEVAKLKEKDFKSVTFVGATSEDKLTPEVEIDGKQRGALSWAFARALEGKADKDGDGEVTQLELLGFVVPAVHAQVESQQTPQVAPLRARSVSLFAVRSITVPEEEEKKKPETDASDTLRVAIDGDATAKAQPSVEFVSDKSRADLIWYVDTGKVEHKIGGVVAENVGADEIGPVLTKWATLKWLKQRAASDPVTVSLPKGNQRYAKGSIVQIEASGARYAHMTVFNLPPDGRVEFFIPDPRKPGEDAKDWRGAAWRESFRVQDPPYGAEHVVAIFSEEILSDLHAALAAMNSAAKAGALRTVLEQVLKSQKFQVGVLDVYTGS
ncbi:MAG: caspase family protein [Methyloligellaceae bacterium]